LPGQCADGALDVAGGEVKEWPGRHGRVGDDGRGSGGAELAHPLQQPAEVLAQQPDLQRP